MRPRAVGLACPCSAKPVRAEPAAQEEAEVLQWERLRPMGRGRCGGVAEQGLTTVPCGPASWL